MRSLGRSRTFVLVVPLLALVCGNGDDASAGPSPPGSPGGSEATLARVVAGLDVPFLDLSSRVSTASEQGLLSLAFPPDYAADGRFLVDFTRLDGDVGQNRFEEVNAVAGTGRGLDFGWDVMEAGACFEPDEGCDTTGLTLPVVEYGHDEGCSVTGGFVHRGEALPELQGTYFYSDLCAGFVRSFGRVGGAAVDERSWPGLAPVEDGVTSFGEDAAGELYLVVEDGALYRFVLAP